MNPSHNISTARYSDSNITIAIPDDITSFMACKSVGSYNVEKDGLYHYTIQVVSVKLTDLSRCMKPVPQDYKHPELRDFSDIMDLTIGRYSGQLMYCHIYSHRRKKNIGIEYQYLSKIKNTWLNICARYDKIVDIDHLVKFIQSVVLWVNDDIPLASRQDCKPILSNSRKDIHYNKKTVSKKPSIPSADRERLVKELEALPDKLGYLKESILMVADTDAMEVGVEAVVQPVANVINHKAMTDPEFDVQDHAETINQWILDKGDLNQAWLGPVHMVMGVLYAHAMLNIPEDTE